MSNLNNIAFKVSKQTPSTVAPLNGVINCRISKSKKRPNKSSLPEPEGTPPATLISTNPSTPKRKRSLVADDDIDQLDLSKSAKTSPNASPRSGTPVFHTPGINRIRLSTPRKTAGPTKLRIDQPVQTEINTDVWFHVLCFSHPEQLMKLRKSIPAFHKVMKSWPQVWRHSRETTFGDEIPDPVSELNEFQYADLRHGHGCQSCGAPSTRKTYWAFLRRWCKDCLDKKTIDDKRAIEKLKDKNGNKIASLRSCIPSATIDSWGNFVGAGPAMFPHHKTVFLRSDVDSILHEYESNLDPDSADWEEQLEKFNHEKSEYVEERQEFAKKLQDWEESVRQTKKATNQTNKEARRAYFIEKAASLYPPMPKDILERCPSYKRSVAIPKEPNMTAWVQLKPKVEAERETAEREALRYKEVAFVDSST